MRHASIHVYQCLALFVTWLFLATPAAAMREPFMGDPPVTRFVPQLDVYPQNFALAQSSDGLLYVGSHDGVLVYDGEQWTLVRLPNGDIVRSLASSPDGRIYVGGYNIFGFLERDETGAEQFVDLAARHAATVGSEAFADIWETLVTGQGIFFRGVRQLFLYDPASDTIQRWQRQERYGSLADYGGRIILQFRGEGLRELVAGEWVPISGIEALEELVFDVVSLPDGDLLLMSNDGTWRKLTSAGLRNVDMPPGFPSSLEFTRGMRAANDDLVFATKDGALVVLDESGSFFRRLPLATGFISALLPAQDGGIFMLSNDAVLHVGWPAEWSMLGREHGLAGSVHAFREWNSKWYVLSGAGVQQLADADASGATFEPVPWSNHGAWSMLPIDEARALLAESYSLVEVKDDRARTISHPNLYPRLLQRSHFDPANILVGTELGFAIFRLRGEEWVPLIELDEMDAPRISSIVEVGAHIYWLGTVRGGLIRLELDPALDRVVSLVSLDEQSGIAYGKIRSADISRTPQGELLVSTHAGLFQLDSASATVTRTELGGLESLRRDDEMLLFAVSPQGEHWAFSFNHVYSAGESGWQEHDVSAQLRGALETITFTRDDAVIFGASSSALRHKPRRIENSGAKVPLALRVVQKFDSDGNAFRLPLDASEALAFEGDDVNLSFRFSLPDYRREDGVRYSARLDGLETQWSNWSRSSGFTYYRMRPGEYQLYLRARDSDGRVTQLAPWRFHVVPPWYATPMAMFAWIVAGIALLMFVVQAFLRKRTERLASETHRLENMVAERTQELEEANRKLEAIAHLDGLTEIPNRRRLDEYLGFVWEQCASRRRSLSVLVIDVDHFKQYNDRFGHIAGDRLLQKLARILSRSLRRSEDLVARYGGEEFLVVLPGADVDTAAELAEQVRATVEASSLGATISVGIAATIPVQGLGISDLVNDADEALYEAKAAGRNCVRAALPGRVMG